MESEFIIVGAGIGGLAAALALTRSLTTPAGRFGGALSLTLESSTPPITVFEQANHFSETGAGIQLGPNAVRVLSGWGLMGALDAMAARPERLQALDARDGRELGALRLDADFCQRYGAAYLTLHRADLHQLLLLALEPQVVHTVRATVVESAVDEGGSVLTSTRDGAQHRAAGLVACDGLWSLLRQQLLNDGPPEPTGHMAYRAMLDMADVPPGVARGQVSVWLGPRLHAVAYPVRRAELMNLVIVVQGPGNGSMDSDSQRWDLDSDGRACLHALRGLCSPLLDVANAVPADRWKRWTLHDRAPLSGPSQLAKGRIALLGDAAHPMRPYLAQGAAMALEDAQTLASAVLASPRDLAAAFRRYAQGRWRRNAQVQRRARFNGTVFHAGGALRVARNLAMRLAAGRLMDLPWLYARPGPF